MVHGISLPSQNTLQKHSYHSPCKNEETEAQKQKALGQREPECREEAEVLPGTEQGIPLLPSAPHSLLYAGTGHTSQSWPCVEQKCAERQQQRMALGEKTSIELSEWVGTAAATRLAEVGLKGNS